MADSFDLIVIGAGSAARDGASKATREHGARVALIESTRWGGGCPNVACRPTKAYLVDAGTVRVGDRELTAERVLIATGSRTAVPAVPGIEDVDWIDHISALELETIPESLLVVGAGPVGLEFAQIFARFGSRVTIVNHGPQIAARADTEAAEELQAVLEEEGIDVILDAGVDAFTRDGDMTVATLPDA